MEHKRPTDLAILKTTVRIYWGQFVCGVPWCTSLPDTSSYLITNPSPPLPAQHRSIGCQRVCERIFQIIFSVTQRSTPSCGYAGTSVRWEALP
jgi:hypothetical protein